jgi:hypothetical protein
MISLILRRAEYLLALLLLKKNASAGARENTRFRGGIQEVTEGTLNNTIWSLLFMWCFLQRAVLSDHTSRM